MSPAFMIAVAMSGFLAGTFASLCCRKRNCLLTNVFTASAGALALAWASRQAGISYAEFGVDFGTTLVFALAGALVALLFTMMARELAGAIPAGASRPAAVKRTSPPQRHRRPPRPAMTASVCGEFQSFLQSGPG